MARAEEGIVGLGRKIQRRIRLSQMRGMNIMIRSGWRRGIVVVEYRR